MEIWNTKSGGNMYSNFEANFRALPKVHFRQAIYVLKSRSYESNTSNGVQIRAETKKL